MATIYKICPFELWRDAEAAGSFAGAPVDLEDGFIHFSTAAQVAETAAKHFAGQPDLLLVAVETETLGEALRWEPSRGGALFPHLYGALPVGAATRVEPLPLGPDGRHIFPPLATDETEGEATAFDPAAAGWTRHEGDTGFAEYVGPLWSHPDSEGTRHGFLVEPRHLNRSGIVHGGMIMTFADQAIGMAAWASNGGRRQATVQLDTHFVSAGRLGEFIEAECRVVRRTRSILFMAAEVKAGDRVVATASGVWKIIGA